MIAAVCIALVLIAGCGGGDHDGQVTPAATSPWAGDYYCWTTGTTYSTVTFLFRVSSTGAVNALATGPTIRGGWTGTGTVTAAGAISFVINNVQLNGGDVTKLTVTGQFTQPSGVKTPAGTLVRSINPGTTLQWRGKPLPACAKTGSWSVTAAGVATTYNYTKAFAIIARISGVMGLSIIFEGPRTAWPAEGFIAVVDPGSVGLNAAKATQCDGLLLGNTAATRYRNKTTSSALPKLTLTARDLRKNGYVTGKLTGTLRNHANTADCVLDTVSFTNITIIDDITIH